MKKKMLMYSGLSSLFVLAAFISFKYLTESNSMNLDDKGNTPNHLINETSPYLLQHAYNPVEWYPWGDEAFDRARKEDKPVLVSIGYSSCHWCHVMEEKVFENDSIAALMNEHLINIKVDREERPDIDKIYMDYVQMTTGSGGWPLNVFMTPDKKPFFAGTYFPPAPQHGRPSFGDVVVGIADAFKNKKEDIEKHVSQVVHAMQAENLLAGERTPLSQELLQLSFDALKSRADLVHGGFGGAPKFPGSMNLMFLLRYYDKRKSPEALEIIEISLKKMADGGIYDHLAGGFHRYSVDNEWQVPHFEKMLYDNALLSRTYLEAFAVTGDSAYLRIATETLDFIASDMMFEEGGFFSAMDADSEGEEGVFYVWKAKELQTILGDAVYPLFRDYYGVKPSGNFENETNILHTGESVEIIAKRYKKSAEEAKKILSESKQVLLDVRNKREKPFTDTKAITSWNAMMLSSYALAAQLLDRQDYLEIAKRNARFLEKNMLNGRDVLRIYNNGKSRIDGFLDDYAALAEAFLNLYEASFEEKWLVHAVNLGEEMVTKFWDEPTAAFNYTSDEHEALIVRSKELMDNATPSGNSLAVSTLLRLGLITGKEEYSQMAQANMERLAGFMSKAASAFGYLSLALDFYLDQPKEIVIVGDPSQKDTRKFLKAMRSKFLPNKVVVVKNANSQLDALSPLAKGKVQIDGAVTAYVCLNYACKAPTRDVKVFLEQLN